MLWRHYTVREFLALHVLEGETLSAGIAAGESVWPAMAVRPMPISRLCRPLLTRLVSERCAINLPRWFYVIVHLGAILAPFVAPTLAGMVWATALYVARNLALIVGYHRYFAHRSFRTSRLMQLLLAIGGLTAAEGGPLWWAQKHRRHHLHADDADDIHSPHVQGLLYAHSGWFLDPRHQSTDLAAIGDFAKYPELRWLDNGCSLMQLSLLVILSATGGWTAVFWGYCVSTVAVWHSTHVIQSVAHLWGTRSYATPDESRNSLVLGLLILGDGWHNNHHYYPSSARHGFHWQQPDLAYGIIVGLETLGLIWDVKRPSDSILRGDHPTLLRSLAITIAAGQEFRGKAESFWLEVSRERAALTDCRGPLQTLERVQRDLASWLERGPRSFRRELGWAITELQTEGCQELESVGLDQHAASWRDLLDRESQLLLGLIPAAQPSAPGAENLP